MKNKSIEIEELYDKKIILRIIRKGTYERIEINATEDMMELINKIDELCSKYKTEEELMKEDKEKLLKYITNNTSVEEKLKNIDLFDKWIADGKKIEVGTYNHHYGVLYKAIKENKREYETIPKLNPEIWEEVVVNEGKSKELLEYEEKEKRADFFSRDKSYKKGETTIFYSKLYEALDNVAGEEPEKSSKWKLIEKPSK